MAMRHLMVVLVALAAVQDGEAGSCGWSNVLQKQNRVINGVEAKPGAWPWIVSLQKDGRHFCGGSLITDKWVLTAAHCNIDSGYVVVAGEHNRDVRDGNEQRVKIKRVINHPSYRGRYYQYDMTLIELASPVRFNKRVQPVCLPSSGQTGISNKCYLAGWGKTQHNGPTSMTLQQIPYPVQSPRSRKCRYKYQNMLCAGNGPSNNNGGGQGDSGGPLVCQQSDGRWTQVGVASFVYPRYTQVQNTFFARVSDLKDWINKYCKCY